MTTIREYKDRRATFIAALRSGKYKQGIGYLNYNGLYCCLGVACDVSGLGDWIWADEDSISRTYYIPGGDRNDAILPKEVQDYFGFENNDGDHEYKEGLPQRQHRALTDLNDNYLWSFEQIADFIESSPDGLWAEGTY